MSHAVTSVRQPSLIPPIERFDFGVALFLLLVDFSASLLEECVDMGEDRPHSPHMMAKDHGWWGQVPPLDGTRDPIVIDRKEPGELFRVQYPLRRQGRQAGTKTLWKRGGDYGLC